MQRPSDWVAKQSCCTEHLDLCRVPVNESLRKVSAMAGILTVMMNDVAELSFRNKLEGATHVLAEAPGIRVANRMSSHTVQLAAGDVVLKRGEFAAASIVACAEDHSGFFVFVSPMEVGRRVTTHAVLFRPTGHLAVWRAADADPALAWQSTADGSVLVLAG